MFDYRNEEDLRVYAHIVKPSTISDMKRLLLYDGYTKRSIEEAKQLIATLEKYREDLCSQAIAICTADYTRKIKFVRVPSYGSGSCVRFELSIVRTLSGIGDATELLETFSGVERRKAFKQFEVLKKLNPGIKVEQDTERRSWER